MNLYIIRCTTFALGLSLAQWLPLRAEPQKPAYNQDVLVKTLLRTSINSDGQAVAYPHDGKAEVSVLIVEIPPGKQTGWHKHPVPLFGYVLSGQVTVHYTNGVEHTFHQGEALAEAVNILHNGVNQGQEMTKLLIFVAGEKNVPFTVKAATDKAGRPLGDYPIEKKAVFPAENPNSSSDKDKK